MPKSERAFTDVEFEVIRGPYRFGEEHRKHKRWYFTGRYDRAGDPLFYQRPAPWWRRPPFLVFAACVGLIAALLLVGLAYNLATFGSWREPLPAPEHPPTPAVEGSGAPEPARRR